MRAFLDIETGGFSATKNGVCEIGIVVVDDNLQTVAEFAELIKPYMRPDPEQDQFVSYKDDAVAIHGLDFDYLTENGKPVDFVINKMRSFLADHGVSMLIGHNLPTFDIPRVNYLLATFAIPEKKAPLDDIQLFCTLKESRGKWPSEPSHKLEDLCKSLGITHNNKHRAIGDCYANIELYRLLTL